MKHITKLQLYIKMTTIKERQELLSAQRMLQDMLNAYLNQTNCEKTHRSILLNTLNILSKSNLP